MLANAKLQTVICTTQPELAEKFYRDTLGLPVIAQRDNALVFDVGGSALCVSPVPVHTASAHTVAGFAVEDLESCLQQLRDKNVTLERFATMPHDDKGIVTTPDGSRVIWIKDPDGNLLSVVQFQTF